MAVEGPDYTLDPPFDQIAKRLLAEVGSQQLIEQIPYELLFQIMTHPDESHFISAKKPSLKLSNIIGPYQVYDVDRSFLCTVNLHRGYFGTTLPEIDYIRKLPDLSLLYVNYVDSDGLMRDIQLIKYTPV